MTQKKSRNVATTQGRFSIEIAARSDVGKVRKNNEDRFYLGAADTLDCGEENGLLLAVADGMGGMAAGEVASALAVTTLQRYYQTVVTTSPLIHLQDLIMAAHEAVCQRAEQERAYAGMGSTLSAVVFWHDQAWVAHVGDSRVYRYRNGLLQLTTDHTVTQALVDAGRLRPEKAATHPRRNLLTQAIGGSEGIEEVETWSDGLVNGDIYLVCSDGLHDMIDANAITTVLASDDASQNMVDQLIDMALQAGGTDNVTVIIVRVKESLQK